MITNTILLSNVKNHERFEPEYYNPEILEILEIDLGWQPINEILEYGQYGLSLPLNETGKGYRIFRLNEIENCFLTEPKKFVELDKSLYNDFKLQKDDVLYCRTNGSLRYVGRIGILKKDSDAVFASYLVRMRPINKQILPEYMVIFLSSNLGRKLIERQAMQSNQFNLSLEQMKKIPIPVIKFSTQQKIKSYVDKSWELIKSSIELFNSAENLLLAQINLTKPPSHNKITYESNLKKVISNNRYDAEYYDPFYEQIMKIIKKSKHGYDLLVNCADNIKSNFDPKKYPQQKFKYLELADVDSTAGTIQTTHEMLGDELPSRAKRLLYQGDVIVSSVEGSLEKVALIPTEYNKTIATNGFFQFRSTKIPSEVILVMAKSIVLQSQLKRESAGTILTAVQKKSIDNFTIPLIDESTQSGIVDLVRQSHIQKKEARNLLKDAKNIIDSMIE